MDLVSLTATGIALIMLGVAAVTLHAQLGHLNPAKSTPPSAAYLAVAQELAHTHGLDWSQLDSATQDEFLGMAIEHVNIVADAGWLRRT